MRKKLLIISMLVTVNIGLNNTYVYAYEVQDNYIADRISTLYRKY